MEIELPSIEPLLRKIESHSDVIQELEHNDDRFTIYKLFEVLTADGLGFPYIIVFPTKTPFTYYYIPNNQALPPKGRTIKSRLIELDKIGKIQDLDVNFPDKHMKLFLVDVTKDKTLETVQGLATLLDIPTVIEGGRRRKHTLRKHKRRRTRTRK
jgi:hypothetical protein